MQIKIIISILGLMIPWIPAKIPVKETPFQAPQLKLIQPLKQPVLPLMPRLAEVYVPPSGAKAYIYAHESGNNPSAVNSIGCRGLGQACPGSKLPCGADYACQDAWFTQYAIRTYGSWENARAFWVTHHWW